MDWFLIYYFYDREKIFDNKFVKILIDVIILIGIVVGIEWFLKKVIKELMNFDFSLNFMNYVEFIMDVVVIFLCSKIKFWRL